MKCIILAAGRGERMMPLTAEIPKPLLKVKGKALIDHVLDSLPKKIDEVIIVVNYRAEQIKDHINKEKRDKKIIFVEGSPVGNSHSFLAAKPYFSNERFLLIYGDEVPNPKDVVRCLRKKFSVLLFNSDGEWIKDGVMVLNTDIFNYTPEFIDFHTMVDVFLKGHNVSLIRSENFRGGVNTPADLERLNG